MTEDLTQKKRVRGAHRRSLRKTLQRVETIITGDKDEYSQLPGLKGTLTEKLEVLSTLDKDIADLLDNEDAIADDIEEADEYKRKICTSLHTIEEALAPPVLPAPIEYPYLAHRNNSTSKTSKAYHTVL